MYPFYKIYYIMNNMKIKNLLLTVIVLFVLGFVYNFSYNIAEPKAYDFMTKHFLAHKYGSDDIVLVVIDAKTVEKYRWPWKREINCKIFDYFYEYTKPKVVVHDSILATLDKDNPESDKKFFNSINKFDNLIVGFFPDFTPWKDEAGKKYEKAFFDKYGTKVTDKSSASYILCKSLMQFPEPYFNAVKHAGSVLITPGFINGNLKLVDEINRKYEFLIKNDLGYYPSIALKVFLLANDNPQIVLTDKYMQFEGLNYKVQHKKTQWQTFTPLKFYKLSDTGYSHTKYSALDVMDSFDAIKSGKKPILNPETFKDKIVIIGANVPAGSGLNDNKNTPISVNHPGVDIQATAIDNIMHNDFVKVIPDWINILITIIGMLFVYSCIRFQDLFKSILSSLLTIGGYILLAAICFYFSIIVNVITPVIMFVLTMILGYTHKFVIENRSKEKVKSAMGKYMSEDVMKRVVQNIDNLGLGGKKATVTVLFADIRGFTSMSEQMSAEQVSSILNEYFSEMEPIITRYNGIINKFIGDAVMAIFGEPIQDKQHAQNAVKCAYAMLTKVKELQAKWAKEGKPKIEIGVGVNTGEVFVGNIGSVNRMEYTVIGDTVNLASRLESYNKIYKTKLLISSSTFEEVKGFVDVLKISDVQIRGKAHKMDIYEVLKVNGES